MTAAEFDYMGTDYIMSINRHAFHEDAIVGSPMFKIRDYETGGVYVDQAFRSTVEKYGLVGLVWEVLI